MAWAKLDDGFHAHPKILRAGNRATGLFAKSLSYAAAFGTDGELSEEAVRYLGGTPRLINTLCDLDLWKRTKDGYLIVDWLEYNISVGEWEEQQERKRAQARERMRRLRERRKK